MTESEQESRVALVTGATRGIGFSTAVALAHRQVRVLLHGRSAGLSAAASVGMGLCVAVGTFAATRRMQPKPLVDGVHR